MRRVLPCRLPRRVRDIWKGRLSILEQGGKSMMAEVGEDVAILRANTT